MWRERERESENESKDREREREIRRQRERERERGGGGESFPKDRIGSEMMFLKSKEIRFCGDECSECA